MIPLTDKEIVQKLIETRDRFQKQYEYLVGEGKNVSKPRVFEIFEEILGDRN